jgi:FtsP/CotA-like multicopper oxidase with cupredoxin domain
MGINGRRNRALSWQDTVNLPVRGEVTVRMRFTDFTGKTVYHCHILNHEDKGMMNIIRVLPAGASE